MKKMKFLSVLAVVFAALSFTACNSESESYVAPTATEASAMFAAIGTYHTGTLIYYSENKSKLDDVTDSIASYCTITSRDSIATIQNFPVNVLSKYISDANLSTAIAKESSQNLRIKLFPYNYNYMTFVANPYDIKCEVTYGGTKHTVLFKFYTNSYLAGIGTSGTSKAFQIQATLGAIYVDSNQTNYLSFTLNGKTYTYAPFLFTAKMS